MVTPKRPPRNSKFREHPSDEKGSHRKDKIGMDRKDRVSIKTRNLWPSDALRTARNASLHHLFNWHSIKN